MMSALDATKDSTNNYDTCIERTAEAIKWIQRSKCTLRVNLPGAYLSIRGVTVSLKGIFSITIRMR